MGHQIPSKKEEREESILAEDVCTLGTCTYLPQDQFEANDKEVVVFSRV